MCYRLSSNNCNCVNVLTAFSYTPKKILPPMDIHITRGPIPASNFLAPSSAIIRLIVCTMPVYGLPPASCYGIIELLVGGC